MTRRWCSIVVAGLMAVSVAGDLLACGDKSLVPSRGVRFELTPAAREQASVLFYVNPSTSLPALLRRLSVDPALRKAGYRPTVVASAVDLDQTLRQRSWDVVLIDFADGPLASSAAGSPAVLAVAVDVKGPEVDKAKKQYTAILKSPTRSQTFVDALDVAVASRNAARAKAAKKIG